MAEILVKGTRIAEEPSPRNTPARGVVAVNRMMMPGMEAAAEAVMRGIGATGFMAVAGYWHEGALKVFVGTGSTAETAEYAALRQAFAAELAAPSAGSSER